MSWLVEVPKTMDYIVGHPEELLMFVSTNVVLRTIRDDQTSIPKSITKLTSEEVASLTFEKIKKRINDRSYILIKIDRTKNQGGEK